MVPVIPIAMEAAGWMARNARCRLLYQLAKARAAKTGKPLAVVGSPGLGQSGARGNAYSCGDLCVDIRGCPVCGAKPCDLTDQGGIPVRPGGAVVFVSYVLEYVDDCDAAWREVVRACGNPKTDAFVAYVQPWATWTRIGTGCNWILESAPPDVVDGASVDTVNFRSARREVYAPAFMLG